MISIILPTYNEVNNIRVIIPNLFQVLKREGFEGEIIVVDDHSPDQTADVAKQLANEYPVRVHVRQQERGLATAVIKGFELSRGDICLVMDADLSHPPEKIPEMVRPLLQGRYDATVGSRYMGGGGSQDWSLARRLVSKGAGLLAKKLTKLTDPTSGFMAIRKSTLEGVKLDPIGWKIVLEVIVKTDCRFLEIPILFNDRIQGRSKLNYKVQFQYLMHLFKLYDYKYPNIVQFLKFCFVGISGLFIDTAVLVSLVEGLRLDARFAAVFAFLSAVTWNYIWNRFWTFEFGRRTKISFSYGSFVLICTVGLIARIGVMHLLIEYAGMGRTPFYIFASLLGICAATVINYFGSRYIAFSRSIMGTREKES